MGKLAEASEKTAVYNSFINNLIVVALDIQHTVSELFAHMDKSERNGLGSFIRDPQFIHAVQDLMQENHKYTVNNLYLMKISADVSIEACNFIVQIQNTNFI